MHNSFSNIVRVLDIPITELPLLITQFCESMKKCEDKYAKFQPSIFTETHLTECHGALDAKSFAMPF